MKKITVEKIIDQFGWSYDFIGREQQRYTKHNLLVKKYDNVQYKDVDVIYIHSPNITPETTNVVPVKAHEKGIKVIGAYGGDPSFWHEGTDVEYAYCDLLVTISPQTYKFAKRLFSDKPVIFLPECMDTNFFRQKELVESEFNVGWAGSTFPIKRTEILDALKYPVIRQSQWGMEHFIKDRSQKHMFDFYHSLNVFVLTSVTECMPRVILEAMSCGLPVVSTAVGNLPMLIDEEWLVPVNPEGEVIRQMNEKLDKLKNDFELQKAVGQRNRDFIENNFSWKKMQPMWDKTFYDLSNNDIETILNDNEEYLNFLDEDRKYFLVSDRKKKEPEFKGKAKIAYVLPGTGISGGAAVVLQQANRLYDRGYDVFLIIENGHEQELEWFPNNNVPVLNKEIEFSQYLKDLDVLIATGWETALKINTYLALTSLDSIIDVKRKIYFVQSDERRFTDNIETKRLIQRTYEANAADYEYMTEALWIQRWLKEEFGHDAYYVPNGLDDIIFHKTEPIEHKGNRVRVLLEGPLSIPFKNVKLAYDVVKDLDCEIWFVSNGGKPDDSWVFDKFFYQVPMTKMKEIYSSCDILLKLSSVEGFFGPPMEAMACGCSVVVGNCTGCDEYIRNGENGLIVDINDTRAIKDAVQQLIDNQVFRNKLIEGGYKTSNSWRWDKSIDFLENVINKKEVQQFYTENFPTVYDYSAEKKKIEEDNVRIQGRCDIIIVTYNALGMVRRCVESIKKHTKFPYKLIIVDNNSNYETKLYLSSIKNEATVLFNEKNYGFGYANNQGLELSKSEYVCFLNSDTIVTDDWLTRMVGIMESTGAGLVGPVTNYVSSTCQLVKDFNYVHEVSKNDDSKIQEYAQKRYTQYTDDIIQTNRLVGFCFVTKRSVLNESGNFDERYRVGMFEDDDLGFRILERGYKLFCANGVFVYHFGGESFKDEYKAKTNNEILERNKKIFIEKWYDTNRVQHIGTVKKALKIIYLLASDSPSGGVKIVFEHANRLRDRGHDVKIVCANNETNARWFNVRVPIIYNNFDYIPDCDIVVGTYFTTLPFLKKVKANVKLHFCQGYEGFLHRDRNMLGIINNGYQNVKDKVVISKWLKKIVKDKYNINSNYVTNGIDQYVFSLKRHKRNDIPRILIVGTDQLEIKGIPVAIEAVQNLKRKFEIVRLSSTPQVNKRLKCEYHDMSKMTQEEIAEVYASCDITICASYKVEGFCFLKDSVVRLDESVKFVQDVLKNDNVVTHKGNIRKVKMPLKRKYNGKILKIKRRLESDEISCTMEHPFYAVRKKNFKFNDIVLNPEWVKAKDLKKGDLLCIPKFKHNIGFKNTLKISELVDSENYCLENNYIYSPHSFSSNKKQSLKDIADKFGVCFQYISRVINKGRLENKKEGEILRYCEKTGYEKNVIKYQNEIVLTDDLMFVLGVYIAEGSCGKYHFQIASHKKENYVREKCKKVFKEVFGIELQERFSGNRGILFGSGKVVTDLLSVLCGIGSKNKKIHPILKKMTNINKLIAGIFYGDGCFYDNVYQFSTSSLQLKYDIIEICNRYGVFMASKTYKRNFNYTVFCLSEYGEKFDNIFEPKKYDYRCLNVRKRKRRNVLEDDYYFYVPISNISEYHFNGEVYNLSVEDDESYLVNDVGVHNCLPPLESMASGTPVITTDSGGVNDYAKNNHNAIVVQQNRSDLIRHNIKLLLDNNDLYNKLADNGLEVAKKYFWHNKIDELEELYYKMNDKYQKVSGEQISLCMIVKNEEKYLEKCLDSVKDIVSEMVIVDTGSTDGTVSIARRFGANIYHYEWDEDFSKARNYSLSKATKPWILVLDADEVISKRDISRIKKLLKKDAAYNFVTRNYVNMKNVENVVLNDNSYNEGLGYHGWCTSSKVRFFPSDRGIKFEGQVHELVEKSLKDNRIPVLESEIIVHHYGNVKRNAEKEKKYVKLSKKKYEENKNDLKSIVELADQYMALNNLDEALVLWRRALSIKPDDMIFLGRMGTTYNLMKDYEQAEKYFLKSLDVKDNEYARRHLGICYAKQKEYQKAYDQFIMIVYESKDLKTYAEFSFCCNMLGKFDESIQILEKSLKINRDTTMSWGLLEVAYNEKGLELAKRGKFKVALNLFNSALKIKPDFKYAKMNIAEINRLLRN